MRLRIEETIFFPNGTVEVRSRPVWVAIIEFWFLWVHEFWTHMLWERVPHRIRDLVYDDYYGDPSEYAFHRFYTWSLNHDATIDKTARFSNLKEVPRRV